MVAIVEFLLNALLLPVSSGIIFFAMTYLHIKAKLIFIRKICCHQCNCVTENRKDGSTWTFVNKAKEWQYEQEYRFMIIKKPEIQRFNPLFLEGIYFGINVTKEDRRILKDLCLKNKYVHVKFYCGIKATYL